jgi:hypothetical protein
MKPDYQTFLFVRIAEMIARKDPEILRIGDKNYISILGLNNLQTEYNKRYSKDKNDDEKMD